MTTALDLITDSLADISVQGLEQPVSAEDASFSLRHLNRMLAKWANQAAAMYDTYADQFPLTPGVASYASTLLTQGRPVQWDDVYLTLSGVSYPIEFINNQQYNSIPFKSTSGLPQWCWVNTSWPNTTIVFYPIPASPYIANFSLRQKVAAPMTLATVISLPPGYEEAIVANLALRLAIPYNRPVSQELAAAAKDGLAWVKRTNHIPLVMSTDQLPVGRRRWVDINRGYS